ncbi:MAG TPA: histone deacetylase [Puia sp.]|nr:histone deacetylase [Puia sp.]
MSERKLQIAWDPVYVQPLPADHRFPMQKYELIPEQLIYEGGISRDNLFSPASCPDEWVLLTHTREWVNKLKNQRLSAKEQRHIGFPQSENLTRREWVIVKGTIDCCHHAISNGVSLNVAGGTHHAFADRGEGFCLLNDFAVAANYLLHQHLVSQLLIVDLDVHQGNGTARIFENNPAVFTFSMHGRHNYPFHKERSDLDIELEDGTDDVHYLDILQQHLPALIRRIKPQLVFFLSGVDVLGTDQFGKLGLSLAGCKKRDEFVFTLLQREEIPCVVAMGGGYSKDIRIIVEAHCNTFRAARDIYGL